jgi:hypothetical protein
MQINREWNSESELFEDVAQALEAGLENGQVRALSERSPYGEDGTITIRTADGRTFKLVLAEVV